MNSIRVKSKDLYVIEVNDNGDTIEFDLQDIELPFKFSECIEKIAEAQRIAGEELSELDKEVDDVSGSKRAKLAQIYKDIFSRYREAIDVFCGKNASQKIFGNHNYISMVSDLFEALAPHFETMGLKMKSVADNIKEKYGKVESDEI